jgi:NADH-quinone oxidoreductase subunit I
MIGSGLIKGLLVTLKHFIATYFGDLKNKIQKKTSSQIVALRSSSETSGLFTIEYPEQQIQPSEEYRMVPFLIYELDEAGERRYRCTACGICSKVCPTQCIWITRKKDQETGKPIPQSELFFIDIDKCMNCGSCAEFCPFDAIKMDHEFAIATYERGESHIYNKVKLGKPLDYYAKIRPENYSREENARKQKATVVN